MNVLEDGAAVRSCFGYGISNPPVDVHVDENSCGRRNFIRLLHKTTPIPLTVFQQAKRDLSKLLLGNLAVQDV